MLLGAGLCGRRARLDGGRHLGHRIFDRCCFGERGDRAVFEAAADHHGLEKFRIFSNDRSRSADGLLRTGTDLPIAPEGYPFEARLLLRNESGGDVRVNIDGAADRGVTRSSAPDGTLRLVIPLKPRVGLAPGPLSQGALHDLAP